MRTILRTFLVSIGLLSLTDAVPVKPDKSYTNRTQHDLFVVTRLRPGDVFQNGSNLTFQVLSNAEVLAYTEDARLQTRIDSLTWAKEKIGTKVRNLDNQLSDLD